MSAIGFVTKRKLQKAVGLAIADEKIPSSPFELYRDGNEIGLIWPSLLLDAPIRVRFDGTIYVGYAIPYARGSIFERGITGFELLK